MKEQLRKLHNDERVSQAYGLIALLILLHCLLVYPERYLMWTGHTEIFDCLRIYYAVLIFALFLLFWLKLRKGLSPELLFLMAYSGWMLITRIAVRDYSLFGELYFSALCFLVFAAGAFLGREQRWRLLRVSAWLLGAILCAYAVLAVLAVYFEDRLIPGLTSYISVSSLDVWHISFFNTVSTISASWFGLGFVMFAVLFADCRSRGKRTALLCIPAMLLMLFVVTNQHCRSVTVAVSIACSMLCILQMLPAMCAWKSLTRAFAAVLLLLILTPAFYIGMKQCGELFYRASPVIAETNDMVSDLPFPSANTETGGAPEERNTQKQADSRSFLFSLLTLTERTTIWKASLKAIAEKPPIALIGQKEEGMMDIVNRHGVFREAAPKQHMHNTHMQALLLTGVPGFLCQLAFSLCLLTRMIRCFFSSAESREKVLTLFMATAMIYGLAEVVMSRITAFPTLWFLLAAGIFVENERE